MIDSIDTLPRFTLDWSKSPGGIHISARLFEGKAGLSVGVRNWNPTPVVRTANGRSVLVVGSPISGEKLDAGHVAERVLSFGATPEILKGLNGQFLVVCVETDGSRIVVAGDRFNGVPLYWADLGARFVAASSYIDLVRRIRSEPNFRFDGESMWTYVRFQRLLGDSTHDSLSRFLMPATRLELRPDAPVSMTRYWRPDYAKRPWRADEAGDAFVGHLQTSLARRTSDGRRYGLFLSGGHDSRTLAAAMRVPFTAFTVAFADNYEVACARRVAAAVGAPFRFLRLPDDHFTEQLDAAAELCGGMYSVDNALFLGLGDAVRKEADVVFHGHGLDYMFHGMYIPARWLELFGRPTFFRRLTPIDGDLVSAFVGGVPYRLKFAGVEDLVLPEARARIGDVLRHSVATVLADGQDVCQTDADRWEYLITHALGRHYSAPNIFSKATCGEQRTVTFDNDLFDFYLSLPPELRLQGQLLRHAMRRLAPAVGRIPTGNWGIRADASPAYKTAWLVARKLLRHATGNRKLRAPVPEDRTWPDRDTYLTTHPNWQAKIRAAVADERLAAAMPFLDWAQIRRRTPDWMSRPSGGAAVLVSLLGLQRFLELSERH